MTTQSENDQESSRFIEAGGLRIHYHDMGKGPSLVLIHGSGPGASGWANFSRNMAPLVRHFSGLSVSICRASANRI